MYWDDEYGEDVPFSFEGEVEFSGVRIICGRTVNKDRTIATDGMNLYNTECSFYQSDSIVLVVNALIMEPTTIPCICALK